MHILMHPRVHRAHRLKSAGLGYRLRFLQSALIVITASLLTVVRCFVNLDQLDDLTQNDSIKCLAFPNIVK